MYKAPVEEIAFTLKHVDGMVEAMGSGLLGDLGEDLVDAILTEAGRFATEEIAPLADIGDRQGARLSNGEVRTPDGWRDLYRNWAAGGWKCRGADRQSSGRERTPGNASCRTR